MKTATAPADRDDRRPQKRSHRRVTDDASGNGSVGSDAEVAMPAGLVVLPPPPISSICTPSESGRPFHSAILLCSALARTVIFLERRRFGNTDLMVLSSVSAVAACRGPMGRTMTRNQSPPLTERLSLPRFAVPRQMFAKNLVAHRPATGAARFGMTATVSDETDDEGRGVPGMKQSHEFRTRQASNPNDRLRTRLGAPEFHWCASMRRKIVLNSPESRECRIRWLPNWCLGLSWVQA
jgi:hypothetical protein